MPGCLELAQKMTGSTSSGPPQPPKDATPKAEQLRGKMTPRPQSEQPGQPMQLTPLWEHVVRTRQFPASVDAESIFHEIFDRLRDPEWEVRQHALRVLVDVLPVLEQNIIDELMSSIVPEVVTNLGHTAPAVRKGALDTLRVYLCYTQNKEDMFQKILDEGFNRSDALDNFQSNVSMGVILSVPLLLFPSSGSPRPPEGVLKFAINALASRLVQVTHQEAALRSLARIREIIGAEEFDSHMMNNNSNVKRDFEVLCDVYNVKIYKENEEKSSSDGKNGGKKEIVSIIKQWSSDSDSSGTTDDCGDEEEEEEDQDDVLVGPMPPARVVLETEIKFDEETAITMTILEEKDKESDAGDATSDSDSENNFKAKDAGVVQIIEDAIPERKNTQRRVRFGGEIVKLRTPDSDEASLEAPEVPRTKIPLPLFPATKMPLDHRRASSQPTSPVHSKHPKKRSSSNSPKREIYMHNALLSPKKSILTRSSSPVYVIQPVEPRKGEKRISKKKSSEALAGGVKNPTIIKQLAEPEAGNKIPEENFQTTENKDRVMSVIEERVDLPEVKNEERKLVKNVPRGKKSESSTPQQVDVIVDANDHVDGESVKSGKQPEKETAVESPNRSSRPTSRVNFDVFPKQERNYILMELSSPERKKNMEKKISANDTPFGHVVNDASLSANISEPKTERTVSDQLLNQIIDSEPTAASQTSGASETTMTQRFPTAIKSDLLNTSDVLAFQTSQELQCEKSSKDPALPPSTSINNSHVRNLQSSKELLDQLNGNVKVGSITPSGKEESENGVNTGIPVDNSHSFREFSISDRQIRSAPDPESESLTCSSSEGEGNTLEPSWEELGLVDQEILNDLHNKDDWRARVRGLERTASALRTSSALVTVEPRLGSLLQAVLGGERSSRIAAAGMAVAKILISGVSEDALRRRLPQLAWGLARQGGPHAAQLARIAMLRLRPTLLLEQLLQPHCLGAKNGKTRENALQLLIFSLVTFPSTEFKVQTVARRVAETVGDRRRRVRQAALDTLAVLGQIYEAEEVLDAGERAASGRHDGDAMKAAIRSRLARKSLPLVSADGLVVYGLQISPNVRIATGADVDWIVAGSGSLSPGSGRSRGQLIGVTSRLDSASIFRSESARSNPWTDRPDFVAVHGAGVSYGEVQKPFAWQLVPVQNQNDKNSKKGAPWTSEGQNVRARISNEPAATLPFYLYSQEPVDVASSTGQQALLLNKENPIGWQNFIGNSSEDRLRLEENLSKHCSTSSNSLHNSIKRGTRSSGEVSNKYQKIVNEYLRKRFYDFCIEKTRLRGNLPPQEGNSTKAESRIPILHSREQGAPMKEGSAENRVRRGEASRSGVTLNDMSRRMTPSSSVTAADRSSFNRLDSRDTNAGYASMYQRRRRLIERNAFQALQVAREVPDQLSYPRQRHGLETTSKRISERGERDARILRGPVDTERGKPLRGPPDRESALPGMTTGSYSSSRSSERRNRSESRSQERHYDTEAKTAPRTPRTLQATPDTYGTMYQRRRRLIEGNAFLALQATENGTSYYPQQMQSNLAGRYSRAEALRESVQKLPERDQGMIDIPTVDLRDIEVRREALHGLEKRLQRPRSRSEIKGLERDNVAKMQIPLQRNTDKAVEDDEDHDALRHHAPSRSSVYEIQSTGSRNSQYQVTRSVRGAVAYEGDAGRSASVESSKSNISVTESQHNEIRREGDDIRNSQNDNQSSNSPASHDSRSSTPVSQTQHRTAAFDVMPFQSAPSRRNSVNSYVISMTSTRSNLPEESIAVEISDEDLSSSDVDVEHSIQDKLSHDCEIQNAEDDTDDTFEKKLTGTRDSICVPSSSEESDQSSRKASRESIRSIISLRKSDHSPRITHSFQQLVEDEPPTPSKQSPLSRVSRETIASKQSVGRIFPSYEMLTTEASQDLAISSPKSSKSFAEVAPDSGDEDGEAIHSSALLDDTGSLQSLRSRSFQELDRPELYSSSNSASIVRSSHSRSNEQIEIEDDEEEHDVQMDHAPVSPAELKNSKSSLRTPSAKNVTPVVESTELLSSNNLNLGESSQSRNGTSMSNVATNGMRKSLPLESELPKTQPSKVPRMKPKPRVNSIRSNQSPAQNINKPSERPRPSVQLCLTQLESKDWEVITKGLKSLSQIARQNPAQLDQCGPGTLGRVLGRHVRNLRSQVSRAACLAAGDVFLSHPKGIEQEIDDIAGPLLHRTADTNKFLRADSNAALDRLVESVSPHKTIGVIVHRGATHQNAIVRATTARLLSDVVNRVGPDQAMTLPREPRDKLLATGAKLLIDGNLDARNYAKKMFRSLLHCEGFQKTLTDAVPETTLRHIDKTLRTL